MRLINSIRIDPAKISSYPELEQDIRGQLDSSTRKFERLKSTISNLVEYTRDIRGFVDVDLLEQKAGRYKPNMAVVRSLRLVKYVLATLIHLTKGDPSYLDGMKPAQDFFDRRPRLRSILAARKDTDAVLLALYNESPRRFMTDTDPRYRITGLLEEILDTRTRRLPRGSSVFHEVHGRQFEESMCAVTGAVLRLLFNVQEVDTDLDVMLYLVKSEGERPVRMKRVFADDVKGVHQKIDHALFLLREAANYVLAASGRDPSFIQMILNQTFVESVLDGCRVLTKELDTFDILLAELGRLKADTMHLWWNLRDATVPEVRALNALMDSPAYRDLLLLARDMKEVGETFFAHVQRLFGYFADLAARERIGLRDLLDRLELSLNAQFLAIERYLDFLPGLEKKLDAFRRDFAQLTLVEGGRSDLYRTIIHEVSQVGINLTTPAERGKIFRTHLRAYEELDLLFDPLYGDKLKNIAEPILHLHETFPPQSVFNLGRFTGHEYRNAVIMKESYRTIVRIGMHADAILDFYGNLLENGKYLFDVSAVKDESALVRRHLETIARHGDTAIASRQSPGG
jgi:hypothetical protein